MKGLHQEGADPAHEGGEVGVRDPRGFIREVKAGFIAFFDGGQPRGDSIRISREEDAKSFREVALQGVVSGRRHQGVCFGVTLDPKKCKRVIAEAVKWLGW